MSRRRNRFGWVLIRAAGCALPLGVLLWWYGSAKPSLPYYLVGDPDRGVHVFEDKGCVYCHAVNGWGNSLAPDLGFERTPRSDLSQLVTAMWNHAPTMWEYMRKEKIGYPSFRQDNMTDLFAYLYVARYLEEPGDSDRGQRVFETKGCTRCHGLGHGQTRLGPTLSTMSGIDTPILWAQAMWNHAPAMQAEMQRIGVEWPTFDGHEMNDLLAYVRRATSGLRRESQYIPADPEHGRQLFQSKSCIACHSVAGEGGHVGPALDQNSGHSMSLVRFSGLMWNHSPKMWSAAEAEGVPRPSFAEEEMADLLAFLCTLRYFEPGGSVQRGQRLFTQRGCSRCHGAEAEGSPLGPALPRGNTPATSITLAEALWEHGPEMYQLTQQLGVQWPVLADGDVGNLLAFLNGPNDN